MKAKYLLLLCCLWASLAARAQQWELLRSFPCGEVAAAAADVYGKLYLATAGGEIKSYSPEGKLLHTYSPRSASYFNSLEARGMQLWAFDENRQQLVYLDRFLNPVSNWQLPPGLFAYASALSPAAGNAVWVADVGDMQLKQWQTDTRQLSSFFRLHLLKQAPAEIKALKAHQHKLYLFSPEALYIFDRLGAFEQMLPLAEEWTSFSFADNDLLLLTTDKLLRISLYSGRAEKLSLPAGEGFKKVVYTNNTYYFFTHKQVQLYRLLP